MAIIPLRAYNREIEGMIDNGQLDETVAHCRHILATFPKHIATYRLLGKAHLEQQRISDATDIFQRVLSAIPDDFIANVGMSIIREDENNLDASIWHMELAYEAQPSNVAIQDELRRLYGRRDGMQPQKVRLTRGALARMYAKGGLFDQAIAELRAAISEDPNRYDLQLLLASMFFQTSQRVEAIDTCINILKKLPYCLAANQILAVCLPETERSSASKNYRQIAISMDPYYAFAAQDAISSDQVAENSVNIERLEWKSGIQISDATAQPTWATSLGVSLEKPTEEKLPEWLKGTESSASPESSEMAQPSVSPFIWDTQEVEKIITDSTKPEGEIPDWMKDAGWKATTSEITQESGEVMTEQPSAESQQQKDLEKGNIPEWLRGIAPEGVLEEPSSSQSKEKDVSIPWLEKQQPGPSDSIIQWLEEAKPETQITPPETESTPTEILDEEVPDWLKDLDIPYSTPAQGEQAKEEITEVPLATPAFFKEPTITEPTETLETKDIPLVGKLEVIDKTEPIPEPIEAQTTTEALQTEESPAEVSEEVPDWIKELAGEGPEVTSSEISGEEMNVELPAITEKEQIAELPNVPEEVLPTKLPMTAEDVLKEEPSALITEEPIGEAAVPSEETPPTEIPVESKEEPAVPLPVILEEKAQIEQPQVSEGEENTDSSKTLGENAALAWLASLAIQESTKEEEQVSPIEKQEATPPEWVKLEAEAITEPKLSELEPQAEEAPAIPAEEIPEWIKGLGETPEIEEALKEPVSAISPKPEAPQIQERPTWLLDSEQPEAGKEASVPSQEALEWKEEELPDWIKEITETAPSKEMPTPIEQPVTEEIPAAPSEPVSELASQTPVAEVGEIKTTEVQPLESAWVPEVEVSAQPEITETVQAEARPAAPPEQQVTPVVEAPEAELIALENARNAIKQGVPDQAAEVYTGLIKRNHHLEEVIKDVQEALYRFPVDTNLWMILGDAYLRTDELQEALNAYTKAEDLVR
jgi:cytochrome c-type biogenesis protein CcmH/NrfG